MRPVRIEKKEEVVTTYKCDLCDYSTEDNSADDYGVAPIMKCDVCGKDVCELHRMGYAEDYSLGPYDAIVCDECDGVFEGAWEWAVKETDTDEWVANDESIKEVAVNRFRHIKAEAK